MLSARCASCGYRLLVCPSHVLAIDSVLDVDDRVVHILSFRCSCGQLGSATVPGPRRARRPVADREGA